MKILKPVMCLALMAGIGGYAQQINPITRAMLNGYEEILKSNPKDYQTLYERAAQLYNLSQYEKALDDITKATEYTPSKESVLKAQEYSLMADIASEMKNYELALKAIDGALAIDPSNYANIYKKGNICLSLNNAEEAYRTFSSLQRLKTRSQEAYFGMAKADIMLGKTTEAEELLKEAEAADPTNPLTFCRVGDLYQDMNRPENAASNYLIGFSMSENPIRPLESLLSLANKNYGAVLTALNFAIEKSDSKMPLLYLKGTIANATGHYTDAQDALTTLLSNPECREAGVYRQLSEAEFALNKLDDAQADVDKAISLSPSVELYLIKGNILLARGLNSQAKVEASKILNADPTSIDGMILKARVLINEGNGEEAKTVLNEIVMTAPDNSEALLLRAYTNDILLKDGKASVQDLNRLASIEAESFPDYSYKAIAKAKVGKKLDADAIIEDGLKHNSNSSSAYYYSAIYYAQTDSLEKGIEAVKRAVYEGFSNKYDLESANEPWFNISPLRRLMK